MNSGLFAAALGGRYHILRPLGQGAMGVVYEAYDAARGHPVALKTVKAASPELLYRIKREFRTLAEITHPNLVALYDLTVEEGSAFFTMEVVEGTDLLDWVCKGRRRPAGPSEATLPGDDEAAGDVEARLPGDFDEPRLRSAFSQLALALDALHRAGKAHRDVKPTNVRVTPEGRVVLLDFGLATSLEEDPLESTAGRVVGTVAYMSPEQALGDVQVTPATDWYAFGVMLYEALAARVPFEGPGVKVLSDKQTLDPAPPSSIREGLPEDLCALCMELLQRRISARPAGPAVLRRLGVSIESGTNSIGSSMSAANLGVFAGRDHELDVLQSCWQGVARSGAEIVLLSGAAGLGKTALAHELRHRLADSVPNLVWMEGRCFEREEMAYDALDGVIDQLCRVWSRLPPDEAAALVPEDAALLPRLFPAFRRVPAIARAPIERRPGGDTKDLRRRALDVLRTVLRRLSASRPVVFFLDSLQWVDPDTTMLVQELLRAPDPPRMLVILCARSEGADKLDALVEYAGVEPTRLRVLPLDREATATLTRRLLGPDVPPALARRISQESGGNPFFISELARYVLAVGTAAIGDEPLRLESAVLARIEALGKVARDIVELLSVAGAPLALGALTRASGLDAQALDRAVRALRIHQLVLADGGRQNDKAEVLSARVREAVLRSVEAQRRIELHRRLALALEETEDGSRESLARHWLEAGAPERAVPHAQRAAIDALSKLEFERAAHLFEIVLQHGELSHEERSDLLVRRGEALACAGRPLEAARQLEQAAGHSSPARGLELRRRAAEELLRGGYLEDGLREARALLGEFGLGLARSIRRAVLSSAWRRIWLRLRGLGFRRRDESELSPRAVQRCDALGSVASGLAMIDPARGIECHLRHLLAALRLGEPVRIARALAFDAGLLASLGRQAQAIALARRARELAKDGEDSIAFSTACLSDALAAYYSGGGFRLAEERLRDSLELLSAARSSIELETARIFHCFALLYRGELRALSERTTTNLREADRRGDRYSAVNHRARLGMMWLARDLPERAEEQIEAAMASWLPAEQGYLTQHWFALHGHCEVLLYRGDAEAAVARLARDRAHLQRSGLMVVPLVKTEWLHLRARCLLAAAASGRREGLSEAPRLGRQLARLSPLGAGLAALVDAGHHALEARATEATRALRTALARLEECDAGLYAQATRFQLGKRLGASPEAASLSAEVQRWTHLQDVQSPERLFATLTPGFEDHGGPT